mmetsp:Transcript_36506/g.103882  ORF Transcript_36506/g.103882 Transcript_36506/m.103882 type:complete len:467 (+) Transcript_36506:871-2271(+)
MSQQCGHPLAAAALAAGRDLHEVESSTHGVACLIALEDLDRLGDRLHLLQTGHLTIVKVRGALRAQIVKVIQEGLVLLQDLLLLIEVLLRLGQGVVHVRELVLLLLLHLLRLLDLRGLCSAELGESSPPGLFDLLLLGQITLHLLLQLLQHTEDLAALRCVSREVIGVRLHESRGRLHGALDNCDVCRRPSGSGRDTGLQKLGRGDRIRMVDHIVCDDGCLQKLVRGDRLVDDIVHVGVGEAVGAHEVIERPLPPVRLVGFRPRKVLVVRLEQRPGVTLALEDRTSRDSTVRGCVLVLGQNLDGCLQVLEGLHAVALHAVELRQLLLAQRGGLGEGLLVGGQLGVQLLDVDAELGTLGGETLDGRGELLDLGRGGLDGLTLLVLAVVAPASKLLVEALVLLHVLPQGLGHLLEQVHDARDGRVAAAVQRLLPRLQQGRPIVVGASRGRCGDRQQCTEHQGLAQHCV